MQIKNTVYTNPSIEIGHPPFSEIAFIRFPSCGPLDILKVIVREVCTVFK